MSGPLRVLLWDEHDRPVVMRYWPGGALTDAVRWERPRAIFLRATPEARWAAYYAQALAELDAEFPTD